MKNKARIPYFLRRQAYRWTRPPDKKTPAPESETCTGENHVWKLRDDETKKDMPCLCGRFYLDQKEYQDIMIDMKQ